MTAREIIEARIGRKLPPVRDMAPDERTAVKLLAIQLANAKRGVSTTLAHEMNRLGIVPLRKPQPKPATGPIATVRKGQEPDW